MGSTGRQWTTQFFRRGRKNLIYRPVSSFSFFSCRSVSISLPPPPSFPLPCLFFSFFLFSYLLSAKSWVAILSIVQGHRLENRAHKASIVGHRLVHALICFLSLSLFPYLSPLRFLAFSPRGLRKATNRRSWIEEEGKRPRVRWSVKKTVLDFEKYLEFRESSIDFSGQFFVEFLFMF